MSDKNRPPLKRLSDYLHEDRSDLGFAPPPVDDYSTPFVRQRPKPPAPKALTLDEYQKFAAKTARYPQISMPVQHTDAEGVQHTVWVDMGVTYCTLGLAGEAGEVANVVKKGIRDAVGPAEQAVRCKKELGDVLWYAAQLATELGMTLSEVAEANLLKLSDRQARGVLGGSGDER